MQEALWKIVSRMVIERRVLLRQGDILHPNLALYSEKISCLQYNMEVKMMTSTLKIEVTMFNGMIHFH
jgi:hypothetical protein